MSQMHIAAVLTLLAVAGCVAPRADCPPAEQITAVAFSTDGELTLRVNDATLIRVTDGGRADAVTPSLLGPGTNSISAELAATGNSPSADVTVFRACRGSIPSSGAGQTVLARLDLTGPGSRSARFELDNVSVYPFTNAPPSGDDGLLAAVQALQAAAARRDTSAYLGFMAPLMAVAAADGMPPGTVRGMAETLLADPGVKVQRPSGLTTRPVLGGRVWEVTDAAGEGPVQFAAPADPGGPTRLSQARYWMQYQGRWGVVEH